jgi:hypothetical protein
LLGSTSITRNVFSVSCVIHILETGRIMPSWKDQNYSGNWLLVLYKLFRQQIGLIVVFQSQMWWSQGFDPRLGHTITKYQIYMYMKNYMILYYIPWLSLAWSLMILIWKIIVFQQYRVWSDCMGVHAGLELYWWQSNLFPAG